MWAAVSRDEFAETWFRRILCVDVLTELVVSFPSAFHSTSMKVIQGAVLVNTQSLIPPMDTMITLLVKRMVMATASTWTVTIHLRQTGN